MISTRPPRVSRGGGVAVCAETWVKLRSIDAMINPISAAPLMDVRHIMQNFLQKVEKQRLSLPDPARHTKHRSYAYHPADVTNKKCGSTLIRTDTLISMFVLLIAPTQARIPYAV